MLYRIHMGRFKKPQIETWDGFVIKATPAFLWSIGKSIEDVLEWVEDKGFYWIIDEIPSSTLQELPTDQQIFKKVSSI